MKILIFDISSSFGHFIVPYTISSPITYPIPTKTAISGMISAIIGIDKREYLKYFNNKNFKIGIKIINPIKILHINENFINVKEVKFFERMKSNRNPRTQINVEFLKDCKYRLYVYHEDEKKIYNELKNRLENHESVYSLSMGLSECLANYEYYGEKELLEKKTDENTIEIHSVVPVSQISNDSLVIDIENPRKYLKVHIPVALSENRELTKTEEILLERDEKSIHLKNIRYYSLDNKENIFLF